MLAVARSLPSGLNATPAALDTVATTLSMTGRPAAGSQNRTVPSASAVARSLPSGLNATAATPLLLPVWMGPSAGWPVARFHSRTVPSAVSAVASSLPSGLNATAATGRGR